MNIFESLDNEKLKALRIETYRYTEGETVFKQGDTCNTLAFIKKGVVEAKTKFDDNKETVIRTIKDNEYIGLNLMFSDNPFYRASFVCKTNTIIEVITKDNLVNALQDDKDVLNKFLNMLSNIAVSQNDHLKLVNVKTIRGKFCYFLYKEYTKNESLEFDITYTKAALSKILNVERPSLCFEIKKLVDEKIIENDNKHYKIISLESIIKNIEK